MIVQVHRLNNIYILCAEQYLWRNSNIIFKIEIIAIYVAVDIRGICRAGNNYDIQRKVI